ncbi:MAG: hypothetical protein RL205_1812 [Actinomycetota bacterium]|jgi:hypothetical protein
MEANNEFNMPVNEEIVVDDVVTEFSDAPEAVTVAKKKVPVGTTETVKHHARKTVVKAKETTQAVTDSAKSVGDSAKSKVSKIDLLNLELPKVEIPKFSMPKIDMPKIDLPKVSLPKVEMPHFSSVTEVKAEVSKVAHDVRGKAASAVTLVREAVGI